MTAITTVTPNPAWDVTYEVTALTPGEAHRVRRAHRRLGGKDGVHAPGARTDPAAARDYVAATGIDALAVAVGSSHAMLTRTAHLDNDLIAATVDVPLVLHGSSGVPDDGLRPAVRNGMVKINVATRLNKLMTAAVC
jgi:fructose-bisphosphate aldolase, class II